MMGDTRVRRVRQSKATFTYSTSRCISPSYNAWTKSNQSHLPTNERATYEKNVRGGSTEASKIHDDEGTKVLRARAVGQPAQRYQVEKGDEPMTRRREWG